MSTPKIQTRIQLNKDHLDWLKKMELRGIDKSSIVNLALSILRPQIHNINSSEDAIVEVLNKKQQENELEY